MDVFSLTRKLIDIESTTGMEAVVGEALAGELTQLGYNVERIPVEGDRCNIWATNPRHPPPSLRSPLTWTRCRHSSLFGDGGPHQRSWLM